MKKNSKIVTLASLFIVVAISVFAALPFVVTEAKLNSYRDRAVAALEECSDGYDAQTIVLNGTNVEEAKKLAEKLDAKLRITRDGSYATLTLRDGVTIDDVYRSREYREYLPKFTPDPVAGTSDVEEVVEESSTRLPTAPEYSVSDTLYSYQTYLDYVHLEGTWNSYRGSGVTVAVIDTGIDTDHAEFTGKISEYSYNATDDKIVKDYLLEDGSYDWSIIEDEQGHGTSVAGVIAASMDGNGTVGIAPEVTLLVIKAECDDRGNFLRTSDLVFGLYYAIERDADVVNMSFGTGSNSFAAPARLADDSDVTLVAAAGNESTSALTYPAADENVIGVGALEDGGWDLAAYSNFGDNTDIVAPGTVYTTATGGGYRTIQGTSFASPIVAASVALLKCRDKLIGRYTENDSVKELL